MRNLWWYWALALIVGTMVVAVGACGNGGDDDDDNDDAPLGTECVPTVCDALADDVSCDNVSDPEAALACAYCRAGTVRDAQIAQCIIDNRDKASGDVLRDECIRRVDEYCTLATLPGTSE